MKFIEHYTNFINEDYSNEEATAVYNADKQKLIAIFSSRVLASKYIYGIKKHSSISDSVRRKTKISTKRNILGHTIAVRVATIAQKELLGNKLYIIVDKDSPNVPSNFLSTANKLPDKLNPNQIAGLKDYRSKLSDNKTNNTNLNEISPIRLK